MEKKILLIEDDGLLARDIKEELGIRDEDVVYSYVSAMDRWKANNGDYDCIILDLNIDPTGLGPNRSSKYIPICGMAFLGDILKGEYNPDPNNPEVEESIVKLELEGLNKVIIHSGFIESLKQQKSNYPYFERLTLIPKSATSMAKLIREVNRIIKT